ncbi:hypothetical protein Tco_1076427 [Tanacetum coccineum]
MDVGSVNVPYLLARYLRMFASGRKQRAMISRGQFVARLAEHFRLLTEEKLQGLTVIVRDLPVIDMAELVRLQICIYLDDTWAWVAPGPERQPDAATGAPEAAEDALVADEGASAVSAPVQACQTPPPTAGPAQTMAQRLARVEEDMMRQAEVRYTIYADFQIPYARRTRRRTDGGSTSTAQHDDQPDP